jgi:hypothetical protein
MGEWFIRKTKKNMEAAISILSKFNTSKEGIKRFVNTVISELEDGSCYGGNIPDYKAGN